MTDILSIRTALCLIIILVVSNEPLTGISECLHHYQLLTCLALFAALDSCQLVSLSEYAYYKNSVYRSERSSGNCRPYASGLSDMPGIYTENYNHCEGTQLRLSDFDLGSEQYSSSDYYVWDAGSSNSQLLFIFPTRVNLTIITLHYYSDTARGLPRLRFYAVPHDFEVWEAPTAGYSRVDIAAVSPGGEPAGRRKVSIGVSYMAKKLLMDKLSSSYAFAVSEVEFFTCNGNLAKHFMIEKEHIK